MTTSAPHAPVAAHVLPFPGDVVLRPARAPRLIDLHAGDPVVTETLVVPVDAEPARLRAVVDDLPGTVLTRILGASASTVATRAGEVVVEVRAPLGDADVRVVADLRVEPGDEGGSYVTSTRRFVAADAAARDRLLDAWGTVRPVADAVARRAVAAIRALAEGDGADHGAPRITALAA